MILIAYHDMKERKIYNSILIFMILVRLGMFGLNCLYPNLKIPVKENVIAALVVFFMFLCMKMLNPSGLGMGDVKLVFVLGLFLGYDILGIVSAAMFFLFFYVSIGKKKKHMELPFAPFVLLAMILRWIWAV